MCIIFCLASFLFITVWQSGVSEAWKPKFKKWGLEQLEPPILNSGFQASETPILSHCKD